jgi:two-component system, cell cycle response regulator DivK
MVNFDGAHVLIVDDNSTSVEVLVGLLDQLCITYTVVYHSHQVGEVIPQLQRLDAIFLDLEMPGRDGYSVLQMLQADPYLSEVPTVAYSAHTSQMAQARQAGFHGFLGKPLRGSDFPTHIDRIFSRQPVWSIR